MTKLLQKKLHMQDIIFNNFFYHEGNEDNEEKIVGYFMF